MDGVKPDTVWTWNAIGKRAARGTSRPTRPRRSRLPAQPPDLRPAAGEGGRRYANADPVTGQAAGTTCGCGSRKADGARRSRAAVRAVLRRPARCDAQRICARTPRRRDCAMTMPPPAAPGSSASSSTSTPASAATPAPSPARNGTPAATSAPLPDHDPYGAEPLGVWFNRVHSYEVERRRQRRRRPCTSRAPACIARSRPASRSARPARRYKRAEDGIVLVDEDICIGCKLCSWACPYGAREFGEADGAMKKCTLCVDRIYNETLARGRSPAGLRAGLPDARAPFRRPRRSRIRRSRSWWRSAAATT